MKYPTNKQLQTIMLACHETGREINVLQAIQFVTAGANRHKVSQHEYAAWVVECPEEIAAWYGVLGPGT